jgi:hypothetical protein
MIEHNCEQGSVEWSYLRMGIPTASQFDRILTPGGKPSKQAEDYRRHLIAELLLGCPIDSPKTSWMERGHDLEGEAVCFYEFERDVAVRKVGFITNDEDTIGASPDRLIGHDGMLEIKCPSPAVHVDYLLWDHVDDAYKSQLQGQLYIAEREWVDICSYHPALPAAIVRVERDDDYIKMLAAELERFCEALEELKTKVSARGYKLKDRRELIRKFEEAAG